MYSFTRAELLKPGDRILIWNARRNRPVSETVARTLAFKRDGIVQVTTKAGNEYRLPPKAEIRTPD